MGIEPASKWPLDAPCYDNRLTNSQKMTMKRRTFLMASLALPGVKASARSLKTPWSSAAPMPLNTQELYPVVHKGRLFVAGGIAAKAGVTYFTNRCVSYDPSTDQWSDEADLPESMHHAALVSSQGRLFLVGGFHGSYTSVWQMRANVYELVGSEWQASTALPVPQAEGVLSTAPDGAIHLVTGQSPRGEANSQRSDHYEVTGHWRWEPGSPSWEKAAPIPTARNSATGGWVSNSLIVTGGRTAEGNLDHTEIYDSKEDRWRTAKPMPLPQAGTAGVAVEGGIMVFGGEIFVPQPDVFANVWRYDLSRDEWLGLPDLPTPRHGLGAGRIGDKIFVVGGATQPSGKGTTNVNEVLSI